MGLIREPLDVDFVVEPRLLTKEESAAISEYIRDYKAMHSNKQSGKKRPVKAPKKVLI
jgi:hypothetical protein